MPKTPKQPAAHSQLVAIGFKATIHEEYVEEVGNGETGPMLNYDPAYTVYENETLRMVFDENGNFVDIEKRDLEAEKFEEEMFGRQMVGRVERFNGTKILHLVSSDDVDIYDWTQCSNEISMGDLFVTKDGRLGLLYLAWPTMLHGETSAFHLLSEKDTKQSLKEDEMETHIENAKAWLAAKGITEMKATAKQKEKQSLVHSEW